MEWPQHDGYVMSRVIMMALVFLTIVGLSTNLAYADSGITQDGGGVSALDTANRDAVRTPSKKKEAPARKARSGSLNVRQSEGSSISEKVALHNKMIREQQAAINAGISEYTRSVRTYEKCVQNGASSCTVSLRPKFDDVSALSTLLLGQSRDGTQAGPPPPVLTPEQAAYVAFARLDLAAPSPGIGPPPSINKWKMAAVGYPLWLWGQGNTAPASVSDSVAGLYVSLDARVSKIVFDMGDGTKVTCPGTGQKWHRRVPAAQKSPVCGHVYQKPSLPQGKYTVTATTHWSVAWTVTGTSGVIPFVQSSSVTLPVGELQVLVR